MVGMPYPLMWGGVIALLNYIPYFGPIVAALLMALGGLMTFTDIWMAMVPPAIMIGCHLVEANVVTPLIVGHRLTINPLMILVSLSFRSEEHTSELQSLMRISYAVLCLNKQTHIENQST